MAELPGWERNVIPIGGAEADPRRVQTTKAKPRLEISSINTTLIGDYTSTVFPEFSKKWLVQAVGNATFNSTLDGIRQGLITVDRRYVFIQLGGNQLRSADSEVTYNHVLNMVITIRDKNPDSRIFILGVLPRPVDDEHVKTLVMKFNRWLRNSVERVAKMFNKLQFVPIQLAFIDGSAPKLQLFNSTDGLTLNDAGANTFRAEVFKLAGFVRNN